MRIGIDGRYIADHFPGIGRYVYNLVKALSRVAPDDELMVATHPGLPNSRYDLKELAAASNIRLEVLEARARSATEQVRWPLAARRWSLDVLHSPYFYKPLVLPCPSLVTIYDLIPLMFPQGFTAWQRLSFRLTVWLALRTSGAVAAISGATRDDLRKHFDLQSDRIRVTPLAADAAFCPRPTTEVAAVREHYRLPENYLLYFGINKPHKNLQRLVEAYARLVSAPPLVLAGREDPRYPQARTQAEALGLGRRVFFPGEIAEAELPALYSGAVLFVFPSLYEGFGLPALEAMACGTPVVCSNSSSLPEVVGDAAVTFDPLSVDDMADAIGRVLADADLRVELRERGRAQATHFTWERTAQETLKAYRALSVG